MKKLRRRAGHRSPARNRRRCLRACVGDDGDADDRGGRAACSCRPGPVRERERTEAAFGRRVELRDERPRSGSRRGRGKRKEARGGREDAHLPGGRRDDQQRQAGAAGSGCVVEERETADGVALFGLFRFLRTFAVAVFRVARVFFFFSCDRRRGSSSRRWRDLRKRPARFRVDQVRLARGAAQGEHGGA